jgi:phosphoribosylanthranilate isomerase
MTQPVRVKICGVTSVADAVEAARLGADAVGLILSKQSPRSVNPQDVPAIRRQLPPFVEAVGVFTDARTLCDLYLKLDLKYVQWHGELSELPEFTPGALAMFRLIVAFRIRDRKTLTEAECWLETIPEWAVPAAILIDGFKKDEPGRTGAPPPWSLLADFQAPAPLILAGGLTPENVAQAIRIVRPYAVDVASGVESSPGKKDPDKMKRFIENARSAL